MNIEIANRLVQLRKANGLSQEELAAKIGISRQAVSKWERAEASPDTDNLILLSRLYGVSLDSLLATEDEVVSAQNTDAENAPSAETSTQADDGKQKGHVSPKTARFWKAFPYPILVTVVYLLLGFLGNWWHPGWLVFLTIPIYYTFEGCMYGTGNFKTALKATWPVCCAMIFLVLGCVWGLWHPGWLVFLTVPIIECL